MIEWSVDIQIIKPLLSFEMPLHIEVEVQRDASYCHEGRFHKNQKHWIILYTYSGQGCFEDKRGVHTLNPESCLLCNPGDPDIVYKYPPCEKDPWRFLWLAFNTGSEQKKCREFYNELGPVFHLPSDSKIINYLESFGIHDKTTYEMSPFEGAQLVMNVFLALGNTIPTLSKSNGSNVIIKKITNYLNKEPIQNASVTNTAKSLNVSREHLSRIFKEQTGLSLQQYILQQKIKTACKLLLQTNLSIKQISARLGFSNQRNFSRAFIKHKGFPPRDYRKFNLEMII